MSKRIQNQYKPNSVSPPGDTLLETLETIGMSQAELAERTGRPKKTINEIIKGKAAITSETALQLERVLGVSASFWNEREQNYREYLARVEEQENLDRQKAWLKKFPIRAMSQLGWIPQTEDHIEQLQEVLTFYGVASPAAWQEVWGNRRLAAFSRSRLYQSDPGAVTAWLRQGELNAQKVDCSPYDSKKFRLTLSELRSLTNEPPETFQPAMINLCASAGVALVYLQELPKLRVSGAACWLNPKKALIQLSLYQNKSDDKLWFRFFHEVCHILRHAKKDVYVDEQNGTKDSVEVEANSFAANTLIPPGDYQRIATAAQERKKEGKHVSKAAIEEFAQQIGVAPGIVVGRLQYEELMPYNYCNDLKQRFVWAD